MSRRVFKKPGTNQFVLVAAALLFSIPQSIMAQEDHNPSIEIKPSMAKYLEGQLPVITGKISGMTIDESNPARVSIQIKNLDEGYSFSPAVIEIHQDVFRYAGPSLANKGDCSKGYN